MLIDQDGTIGFHTVNATTRCQDRRKDSERVKHLYATERYLSQIREGGGNKAGMDEFSSEMSRPWSIGTSSMNAVSFGFLATAILMCLFLVMAIFEHLFTTGPLSLSSPEDQMDINLESGTRHKLGTSLTASQSFFPHRSFRDKWPEIFVELQPALIPTGTAPILRTESTDPIVDSLITAVSCSFRPAGYRILQSNRAVLRIKMVVLAASIITKSGKALVSRQFVDMSRIRIEGYLAAFPKLVGIGKQHTYVETENVRYVYHPIESLYLLLVTNKQSNILEDLETLRLLSKVVSFIFLIASVPEYSYSLDEEGICKTAFELLFAFDEVISLGHKENINVVQVKQYCEMESHEEKLHKLVLQSKINETKDVMKRKASEIDKSKIEKNRGDKGGFMSLQSLGSSGRLETGFGNDTNQSSTGSGFGNSGSGFGLSSTDVESFSTKSKGHPPSSASAPPKGLGMKLGKTQRANQFLESLKAEGEMIVEDVRPSVVGQSKPAAAPLTDPVTLTVEEKLNVTLKRDGGVSNFDVQGTLSLQILSQDDGFIQVQIETSANPAVLFKTHPNINKELFANENILGLKDPNRPFPSGQSGDGVGLLKWRMQSSDESILPLTLNCWPSVSGKETYVNIEYETPANMQLQNVIVSVPLPALRDAPNVQQIDGEWRFDSRNSILEWSIVLIDNSNRSGSLEFVVPAADPSQFFPISARFTSSRTFSDLKVVNVLPLRADPKSFSNTTHHSQSPETQEFNEIKKENIISRDSDFDDHQEQQDDSKSGSGFGVKLTRSSSVASSGAPQQRFRLERAGSRRVKKAFSMRRSSSVSERYCRIHNQCVTLSSPTFDDGDMDSNNGDYAGETSPTSAEKISGTVKSTSEKLLRACKRFLRL
nr:coatomer subunit delta-like [Ipomoea batatas]